ncbi:hypothetical protein [Rufibacter latericius]|uniref:Uncharacterized protein n=1 Tax=Rufibacter latericius TaxID=2487040 RepID=A0A3M9MM40_9BACT|nr:hypothetical protein [Rufibacter latericius]RNI26604.1 hypothetical protein EFB08_11335 [Rufibacter latericius]
MEEHYDDGYGQAEAEAQYADYLDQLCKDGLYYLFAFEVMIDLLNTNEFKKSVKTAEQFLFEKKQAHIEKLYPPKEKPAQNQAENLDDDLPF